MSTKQNNDWPAGYGRRVLASVDSTNSEAARIAGGLAASEWVLALEQTTARGRRGRAWNNPAGNFSATLVLLCDGDKPHDMALRSFIASLALYDAVATVTGRSVGLALKWPNDVILNGGKLAGILLESLPHDRLAIGIGVNLVGAPDASEVETGAMRPVSLLSETGANVLAEEFLDYLAPAFARYEDQFRVSGFAPIRREWLARAAKLGETITARTGTGEYVGIFEDVDGDGNLVQTCDGVRRAIPAADVYF